MLWLVAEQNGLNGGKGSLRLGFLPAGPCQSSSKAMEICVAPWVAMLRNTMPVALCGPLP